MDGIPTVLCLPPWDAFCEIGVGTRTRVRSSDRQLKGSPGCFMCVCVSSAFPWPTTFGVGFVAAAMFSMPAVICWFFPKPCLTLSKAVCLSGLVGRRRSEVGDWIHLPILSTAGHCLISVLACHFAFYREVFYNNQFHSYMFAM